MGRFPTGRPGAMATSTGSRDAKLLPLPAEPSSPVATVCRHFSGRYRRVGAGGHPARASRGGATELGHTPWRGREAENTQHQQGRLPPHGHRDNTGVRAHRHRVDTTLTQDAPQQPVGARFTRCRGGRLQRHQKLHYYHHRHLLQPTARHQQQTRWRRRHQHQHPPDQLLAPGAPGWPVPQ